MAEIILDLGHDGFTTFTQAAPCADLLGNIVVGIIGAFLAKRLLPALNMGFSLGNPIITSIACAMVGTIVLPLIIGLIKHA